MDNSLIKNEPVMIVTVINCLLTLTARFGFNASPEEVIALSVIIQLVLGWIARSKVTPTAKLSK